MSEQEQPIHGGSYRRQPDGSLVRNEDTPTTPGAEAAPRPRQKPSKEK